MVLTWRRAAALPSERSFQSNAPLLETTETVRLSNEQLVFLDCKK